MNCLHINKIKLITNIIIIHTQHTDTHLSGTARVSWYQKGKTNLDFSEARNSEWQMDCQTPHDCVMLFSLDMVSINRKQLVTFMCHATVYVIFFTVWLIDYLLFPVRSQHNKYKLPK